MLCCAVKPLPTVAVFDNEKNENQSRSIDTSISNIYQYLENQYFNTHTALHLGCKETFESKMIRSILTNYARHDKKEMDQRLSQYNKIERYLSHLTNEELSSLLTTARSIHSGIGGDVLMLEVDGLSIIIKKVRLSAIEEQNVRATHNVFELPTYYQYGVGSMGFGAWRERLAHEITTQWVLKGECHNFPIMYHSRVLERTPSLEMQEDSVEGKKRYVEYWDGSSSVGTRSEAVHTATKDVVIFMEYIPYTLHKWLCMQGSNNTLTEAVVARVEYELNRVCTFMKSKGFLHFDAHFHNILASDNHVYFADFGLAMSQEFDLSQEETAFYEKHIDYDQYYVAMELFKRPIIAALGKEKAESVITDYFLTGALSDTVPTSIASIAKKYGKIARLMGGFFQDLQEKSKSTPYPERELARAWYKA